MHLFFDQLSFGDAETAAVGAANGAADRQELDLTFDNDFAEVHRHDLDEHGWIEVFPQLIHSPERLFTRLLNSLGWTQRRRWIYDRKLGEPRLTADYPDIDTAPVTALRTPDQTLVGRRLLIKPRDGGPSARFVPASGDLIGMRGRCQSGWRHAVPEQVPAAGPRISVNFRARSR